MTEYIGKDEKTLRALVDFLFFNILVYCHVFALFIKLTLRGFKT